MAGRARRVSEIGEQMGLPAGDGVLEVPQRCRVLLGEEDRGGADQRDDRADEAEQGEYECAWDRFEDSQQRAADGG